MAKSNKGDDDKQSIIIIKRVKKGGGGHHGGAWKVAYADFVTAMMAFFLLLWLLSVTTEVQKQRIADYFSPTDVRISKSESGAGGVLGGQTVAEEGAITASGGEPDVAQEGSGDAEQKATEALDQQDERSFKQTEEEIRQALEETPDLKELAQHLLIDMTPEGLRIQIIDQDGKPMFQLGSAIPLPPAEKLLQMIAGVIKALPNKISVRGHTDSKQYGKDAAYSNWELSADRSNASRRIMTAAGLDIVRVENVQGKADRELLDIANPDSARNRRISIILLKQSIITNAKKAEKRFKNKKPGAAKPEPKKREEGVIYFP